MNFLVRIKEMMRINTIDHVSTWENNQDTFWKFHWLKSPFYTIFFYMIYEDEKKMAHDTLSGAFLCFLFIFSLNRLYSGAETPVYIL